MKEIPCPEEKNEESCTCPTIECPTKNSKNIGNKTRPKTPNQSQIEKNQSKKKQQEKVKTKKKDGKADKSNTKKRDQNPNKSPTKLVKEPSKQEDSCDSDDAAESTESCESTEVEETFVNKIANVPKIEVLTDDPNDKEIWIEVKKRLDTRAYNRNSRSSSENSRDCGYASENISSTSLPCTPEGSEVACNDNCCNHEGDCPETKASSNLARSDSGISLLKEKEQKLTLLQMLEVSIF